MSINYNEPIEPLDFTDPDDGEPDMDTPEVMEVLAEMSLKVDTLSAWVEDTDYYDEIDSLLLTRLIAGSTRDRETVLRELGTTLRADFMADSNNLKKAYDIHTESL